MRTSDEQERGFATAETAMVLPALLAVVSMLLGVIVAVGAQLRCVDAARGAARVAARGESEVLVRQAALRAAPRGATVTIRRRGGLVEVEVRARVLATRLLPAVHVQAAAAAEQERR